MGSVHFMDDTRSDCGSVALFSSKQTAMMRKGSAKGAGYSRRFFFCLENDKE